MTAPEIVASVDRLEDAIEAMQGWMRPGGLCCGAPRSHGYCTNPGCAERHDVYAAHFARLAAREARTLMMLGDRCTA